MTFESSIFNISVIDNIGMKMYLYAGIYRSNCHNVKTWLTYQKLQCRNSNMIYHSVIHCNIYHTKLTSKHCVINFHKIYDNLFPVFETNSLMLNKSVFVAPVLYSNIENGNNQTVAICIKSRLLLCRMFFVWNRMLGIVQWFPHVPWIP